MECIFPKIQLIYLIKNKIPHIFLSTYKTYKCMDPVLARIYSEFINSYDNKKAQSPIYATNAYSILDQRLPYIEITHCACIVVLFGRGLKVVHRCLSSFITICTFYILVHSNRSSPYL